MGLPRLLQRELMFSDCPQSIIYGYGKRGITQLLTPRDGCCRKIDASQDHDLRRDSATHRDSDLSLFLSRLCSLLSSLWPSELMSLFEEHPTSLVTLDASIIESQPYDSTVTSSDIHQLICAHSFIFMTWLNRPFSPVVKICSCFPRRTNL